MRAISINSGFREERWVCMMALSFCLHLAVFSTILFVPQTSAPYPSLEGRVYNVELVGFPSGIKTGKLGPSSGVKGGAEAKRVAKTTETSNILGIKTRRIAGEKKETLPISAKRVASKPRARSGEEALSPSELIDKAISKIERKVEKQKAVQTEEAGNGFEGAAKALSEEGSGVIPGTSSDIGITIKLYQMEIEHTIKNNWSYPVALVDLKSGKIPEAVVMVTVRRDGKILKAWFKRRSNNPLFDESVMKAIEKSDPLPAFPDGYRKSYDEVEINFSLKDLA
jgi:colicin import membrane protein